MSYENVLVYRWRENYRWNQYENKTNKSAIHEKIMIKGEGYILEDFIEADTGIS